MWCSGVRPWLSYVATVQPFSVGVGRVCTVTSWYHLCIVHMPPSAGSCHAQAQPCGPSVKGTAGRRLHDRSRRSWSIAESTGKAPSMQYAACIPGRSSLLLNLLGGCPLAAPVSQCCCFPSLGHCGTCSGRPGTSHARKSRTTWRNCASHRHPCIGCLCRVLHALCQVGLSRTDWHCTSPSQWHVPCCLHLVSTAPRVGTCEGVSTYWWTQCGAHGPCAVGHSGGAVAEHGSCRTGEAQDGVLAIGVLGYNAEQGWA